MSAINKTHEYWTYLSQARNAPSSTEETRVALVSQELGLSDADLEPFYFTNRKGAKKRFFNHEAFAQKYGVDVHWLWEGSLREHPRHLKPPARRTNSNGRKQRRSKYGTPEERAARGAAAKARAASVVEISGSSDDKQRPAAEVSRPTFVEILQCLRVYIVQQFAIGKDIDQIFDEIITSAPAELR
jgi:hypothetical protein